MSVSGEKLRKRRGYSSLFSRDNERMKPINPPSTKTLVIE
jgi:hypothetical protein